MTPGVGIVNNAGPVRGALFFLPVLLVAAAWLVAGEREGDAEADQAKALAGAVGPFLEEYCLSCHAGKRAKGDVDLRRPKVAVWRRVRRVLKRKTMPPLTQEQPPPAARERALAVLDRILGAVQADPGRVTARRLNRTEYENTIRDLLAVDFDARALFPPDEVGHGFDNIGDVLSLPPALLEKYFAAAEEVARKAVLDESPDHPPRHRFPASRLKGRQAQHQGAAWLYSPGEIFVAHDFRRAGRYVLRVRAFGQQVGTEAVKMAFRLDGRTLQVGDVPATVVKPGTYEHRLKIPAGEHRVGVGFVNDYYRPRHPDPSQRDRNMAVASIEIEGPLDRRVLPVSHRRLVPVDKSDASFRRVVKRLAGRAWRRPLTNAETTRLLAAVQKAAPKDASFESRLRVAITAVLVSPRFLFRAETDPKDAPEIRDLDGYEIATRLSYFAWSSMPDDALFARAAAGELARDDVLVAEIDRLLHDPRASALARNFASQWLRIRGLDEAAGEGLDDELKEAMRTETEMFFEAILREDRPVHELIEANFTFANQRLAKLYGLPGVRGPHLRRVRVDGVRRGGVLTQASVLAMTSNPGRTSPVKRGKWILEALLDAAPPPPEPGADSLPRENAGGKSLREQLETHRKDPKCAQCHIVMDELGFSLENYDMLGRWRDRDGKHELDTKGKLPDGRTFQGPAGLRKILRNDPRFLRSLAKHMLVYALGRGLTESDDPAVDQLVAALKRRPRLSTLIREIVTLDAFRRRRVR